MCNQPCVKPALDHDHHGPNKDKIRGVVCRVCNIYEGKLRNASFRTGGKLESLRHFAPSIYGYITADYSHADWHPSKRKSEVTEFRKMNADEQHKRLSDMMDGFPFVAKNATERIKIFRKLNNKL